MKKKTYIFTAVALLALLPSCQQETLDQTGEAPSPADYIQFGTPTVILNTESRSITKDALTEGDAFGVLGYCLAYNVGTETLNYNSGSASWNNKKMLCPPSVFYKQKVTVSNGGTTYDKDGGTDNNPKYWYVDGKDLNGNPDENITNANAFNYSFIGYYPYGDEYFSFEQPENASDPGAPILTFTMPQENNNLDASKTPDAMLGVAYNVQKGNSGKVQFNFSHILTGLGFEINNYSDYDLTVHSLTLSGSFYKEVKIDLTGAAVSYEFPQSRYNGTYSLSSQEISLPAPSENEAYTSSESPIGGEHLLLISGDDTSFGEEVKVNIDYTFNGDKKTQEISRNTTFRPQPGVKYTAQLNFVGNAFVLQFVVDNGEIWEDGEAADGKEDNDDIIFE